MNDSSIASEFRKNESNYYDLELIQISFIFNRFNPIEVIKNSSRSNLFYQTILSEYIYQDLKYGDYYKIYGSSSISMGKV